MKDQNGAEISVGDRVFYRGPMGWPKQNVAWPVISLASSSALIIRAPGTRTVRKKGKDVDEPVYSMTHCVLASLCIKADAASGG